MYEGFYTRRVGDFNNYHGGIDILPVDEVTESEAVRTYWTLYGRKPDGTSEALIDGDNLEHIKKQCKFFNGLLGNR